MLKMASSGGAGGTAQVAKTVMEGHYISVLPFKPKTWVMYHQLATLEEAVVPM